MGSKGAASSSKRGVGEAPRTWKTNNVASTAHGRVDNASSSHDVHPRYIRIAHENPNIKELRSLVQRMIDNDSDIRQGADRGTLGSLRSLARLGRPAVC